MTVTFTLETARAAIGTAVTIDGYAHALTLREVVPAPERFRPPELPAGFTAVLTGPATPVLAEGTHAMLIGGAVHSLHIIPISAPGTAGQSYQIVVN